MSDSVSSVCDWASSRAASGAGLMLLLELSWLVAAATCGCGCSALAALWLEAIVVRFCIVDKRTRAANKGLSKLAFISHDQNILLDCTKLCTQTSKDKHALHRPASR